VARKNSVSNEIAILAGTVAAIAFVHTILRPDHCLPFIALARARQWSGLKTAVDHAAARNRAHTGFCGFGVYRRSRLVGLEAVELFQGEPAAWLLLA